MNGMETIGVGVGLPARPPLGAALDALARVARLELDSAWVIDHFSGFIPRAMWDLRFSSRASPQSPHSLFEFQVLLGYLAANAGRVQLGVGVTESFRRHPVLLAQAALTLSHILQRPFILGIGSGERMNIEPYGIPFTEPTNRLEEAVKVIRLAIRSDGPVDFEGKFNILDAAVMDLQAPDQREPVIWVAAHGPRTLGIAGREGDGWLPTLTLSPEDYRTSLAMVRRAAVEAGRNPMSILAALQVMVVASETRDGALEQLRTPPVRLWTLLHPARYWHALGASHPLGDNFEGLVDFLPERLDPDLVRTGIGQVPDEVVGRFVLSGTPNDIIAGLSALSEAGCQHFIINAVPGMSPPDPEAPTSIFSLASDFRRSLHG